MEGRGFMTKGQRGTSSVNASDPRNEAATKRGALRSTCLFESGEIWFGERWAAPLSAQPRRTAKGTQLPTVEDPFLS